MTKAENSMCKKILLIATFLLTASLLDPLSFSDEISPIQCSLKATCAQNEICWFTQNKETDAHISDCSDPYNYKLCCTTTASAAIKSSCNSDEFEIFSVSHTTGDAHVADFFNPFSNRLCVKPTDSESQISVRFQNSPLVEEGFVCLTSFAKQDDSHVSYCGDAYDLKVYVRVKRGLPIHTMSTHLNIQDNDNKIAIHHITPDKNLAELGNEEEFIGSYMISYGQQRIVSIMATENKDDTNMKFSQIPGVHSLKITEPQTNSIFLVFTKGDGRLAKERFQFLRDDTFDGSISFSFGYALEELKKILISSNFGGIVDIGGYLVFHPGIYRIGIEKESSNTDGTSIVRIEQK